MAKYWWKWWIVVHLYELHLATCRQVAMWFQAAASGFATSQPIRFEDWGLACCQQIRLNCHENCHDKCYEKLMQIDVFSYFWNGGRLVDHPMLMPLWHNLENPYEAMPFPFFVFRDFRKNKIRNDLIPRNSE